MFFHVIHKIAVTCDFQQCGIFTSVDSNEHAQPLFKLRKAVCCSVSSLTVIEYSSDQQRLWSDCAYGQAGVSLCWSHVPQWWKFHGAAQMSVFSKLAVLIISTYVAHTPPENLWLLKYSSTCSFIYFTSLCTRLCQMIYNLLTHNGLTALWTQ